MNASAEKIAEVKATTIAESFTTSQTTRILDVSRTTIQRRRQDGKLYAFPHGRQWLYPAWQFGAGSTIPGLKVVIPAITLSMHPAFVRGMMLAPRPWPAADDAWESPRTFLINGGDPARVAAIFEELAAL
jgi:hypothetical protein